MTHQALHDSLQQLEAARVADILQIDQRFNAAKAELQAQCGALGHIYTRLPYAPTAQRTCAICGLPEPGADASPAGPAPTV